MHAIDHPTLDQSRNALKDKKFTTMNRFRWLAKNGDRKIHCIIQKQSDYPILHNVSARRRIEIQHSNSHNQTLKRITQVGLKILQEHS